MTYFTNGIKFLIDQNELSEATNELLTILKYGKEEIHEQAVGMIKAMVALNSRKSKKRAHIPAHSESTNLREFLTQLEKDELPMVRFLSHIELGEEKIKKGDWKEASIHFELAGSVHHPSFSLSTKEIEAKISLCKDAIAFNRFVDQGNNHFLNGDWESAIRAFKQTLDLAREDFGVDVTQIKSVIATCSQGIHFNRLIDKSRELQHQRNWAEACELLQKAQNIHREEFYTSLDSIKREIAICQNKVTSKINIFSLIIDQINMEKPYVTLSLILGSIGILFLIFHFFSEPYPSGNVAQNQPSPKAELTLQPSDSVEIVEDELAASESTIENVNSELQINDQSELDIEPRKIEEKVPVSPPIFSNTPTPIQIQQLIEPENTPVKVVQEIKESPNTEELSSVEFEAGKVVIIPFCNGLEDGNLARKAYKDASFAIRAAGKSGVKTVSQTLVKGTIQDLGLINNDFCSEAQAIAIARSLGAENVITGNLISLPDNQTRIICEVLHVPTGKYSQEIVITDVDQNQLRANLKKEISKIFN